MGRTKQGGSILGYVLVGGVLTVLLLGGAYALRNNWSGQPADTPSEVVNQPTNKPAETKDDNNQNAPSQQPAPQPAAPTTPRTTPQTSTAPGAQQLPQTGPAEDALLSVSILVIMLASFGVYLESRRLARSL